MKSHRLLTMKFEMKTWPPYMNFVSSTGVLYSTGMIHQPTTIADEELVLRTVARDAHAFEILFERYAAALNRHVLGILHDEIAANDDHS